MTRTALVTDSTSNLPRELAVQRHIYMAPLYVMWKEKSYKDGVDITDEEFFRRLRVEDELPKTSQVSAQDFAELFEQAHKAESAEEIVCATVSSDLSGTYASAIQAKEMVKFPVHVLDTRQVSWALGFPVLAGADARDSGAGAEAIVQTIRETALRSCLIFTVESLHYLHRGGRIGNASWLLGSALSIKPLLELKDGVVEAADKVRTRKKAVEHLLKTAEERAAGHPIQRFAVMHGGVEEEARALLATGKERFHPQESYLTYVTAVLGVHVGPGALGVIVQWQA